MLGTLCALIVVGFGVYGIANAAYQLWIQHSGVPAQVKVEHCKGSGVRPKGWAPKTCTAIWPQTDGTQRTVIVHGPRIAYAQIVDVHIRGDEAYTDGPWPWRYLLIGILLVGVVVGLFVLRRRRNRAPPGPDVWS